MLFRLMNSLPTRIRYKFIGTVVFKDGPSGKLMDENHQTKH